MSGQVSRGSAGEYQADDQAGVARGSTEFSPLDYQGNPQNCGFFFVVYKTEAIHLANMDGHHFVTIYTLISVKYYFNHVN